MARPDQHALTTRLLSFARRLLLVIALCAYVAAARVALAGAKPTTPEAIGHLADSLETWLWILTVIVGLLFSCLVVTWARGSGILRRLAVDDRFGCNETIDLKPGDLEAAIDHRRCPLPNGYTAADPIREGRLVMTRSAWHGDWSLTLELEGIADVSLATLTLEYVSLAPAGFVLPFLRRSEARRMVNYLKTLSRWSEEQGLESKVD